MAVMLFKLRDVPEDEAQDVRVLLDDNGIAYYETPPSRWGISMEAIWLRDEAQLELARELIHGYQQERLRQAQEAYARLKQEGKVESLAARIKKHPLLFLICLAMAGLVGYVSVVPFLTLGQP